MWLLVPSWILIVAMSKRPYFLHSDVSHISAVNKSKLLDQDEIAYNLSLYFKFDLISKIMNRLILIQRFRHVAAWMQKSISVSKPFNCVFSSTNLLLLDTTCVCQPLKYRGLVPLHPQKKTFKIPHFFFIYIVEKGGKRKTGTPFSFVSLFIIFLDFDVRLVIIFSSTCWPFWFYKFTASNTTRPLPLSSLPFSF